MLPWGKRAENVKRAEEFVRECCQRLDLGEKMLGKSGREWIARRRWSDGEAEMRRVVYYAVLTAKESKVEAEHFPPRSVRDLEASIDKGFDEMALEDLVGQKIGHFFERLGRVEASNIYKTVLRQVERPLIARCLKWADGNQQKAARVLGINRNTLRKKMKELGIK